MKILLAIPTYCYLIPQCVKSFYNIRVPEGITMDIEFITGYGAAQSRNKAANKAIDEKYDWLLFIDADQIAPPDTLEKLLNCYYDIAAGWSMMCLNDNRTNISIYDAEKRYYGFYTTENLPQGIIDVDAIGFACIMIKTSVFAHLYYPYFKYVEYPHKGVLSEDLFFCDRVKQEDFKIMCDTSLQLQHVKTKVI